MKKVLVFSEDPGSGNYMKSLPNTLDDLFTKVYIISINQSKSYLASNLTVDLESMDFFSTIELLTRLEIDVLIVGTSENINSFAFLLIECGKKLNIKSIGMVDSSANSAFRFRGNSNEPLAYVPDYLLVSDEKTKSSFIELGFDESKINVFNNPYFDILFEKNQLAHISNLESTLTFNSNLSDKKNIRIVFVSELSTGLNSDQFMFSDEYTLNGNGSAQYRTEIVIEEFLNAISRVNYDTYLILRLHPKETKDSLLSYHSNFDYISIGEEVALDLVKSADLVVGMTSVLLKEASLMGKPVLSILPRKSEEEWHGDMIDKIKCVFSSAELEEIIQNPDNWSSLRLSNYTKKKSPSLSETLFKILKL